MSIDTRGGPATASDHSLLRRLRAGQGDAATALYVRYASRLLRLAHARTPDDLHTRVDAEDIVQSAFTSFFRGASQGYYDVPPGEELWGLLLVITLNKIRAQGHFHRAARRDVRRTTRIDGVGPSDPRPLSSTSLETAGDDALPLTLLRMMVDELLAALPDDHRAIVLARIDGCQIDEIAEQTRRSRRTVERVLQEFRHQLSRVLEEGGHGPSTQD
jgi:RNA polymerase sigma-70 factor, ECF subfamily